MIGLQPTQQLKGNVTLDLLLVHLYTVRFFGRYKIELENLLRPSHQLHINAESQRAELYNISPVGLLSITNIHSELFVHRE